MPVSDITTLDELNEILDAHRDVVVEFGASWCAPCRSFRPHFEAFSGKTGVTSVYCTIEDDPAVAGEFGIQTIPQVYHFRDGSVHRVLEARTAVTLVSEYLSEA